MFRQLTTHQWLMGLLYVSLAWEVLLAGLGFLMPEQALIGFRLPINPDTLFLGHVLAWMLLLISLLVLEAILLVRARVRYGTRLVTVLGIWWLALGVVLAFRYGRYEHLLADSLKGALLVYLANALHREHSAE
jgi:hypothetical protein